LTVSTTTSRADYNGNGTTTAFAVPFYFLDNSHLTVLRTQISTGVITTLALTTDYTVTGAGVPAGGTVTCLVAPTAGQKISILRNVPLTQLNTYVPNDPFPAASHEQALDKLTMEVQQLDEAIDRALTLPANTVAGSVSATLPTPEANKFIGWNSAANGLQNLDASTLATITAYGGQYVDVFSGTGSQTQFTLSQNPGTLSNLSVSISGVVQRPTIDYTYPGGSVLNFVSAPAAGTNNIMVQYGAVVPTGAPSKDAQTFDTVAIVNSATIDASVNHIRTAGYYTNGDGGGALYKRVTSGSTGVGTPRITSNGAAVIWELAENIPNVKQFGARGDGTTNDTSAMQGAIDAMSAGDVLYFPKSSGAYMVDGLAFSGTGQNKTRLSFISDGATIELRAAVGSKNTAEIVTGEKYYVRGITFRGNKGTVSPVTSDDLTYRWHNGLYVGAIATKTLSDVKVEACTFENCHYVGLMIGSGPVAPGNILPGIDGGTFSNNVFLNNENGVAGGAQRNVTINGSVFRGNNSYSILIDKNSTWVSVVGNTMDTLDTSPSPTIGIYVYEADYVTVQGNSILDGKVGISVSTQAQHASIVGNTVTSTSGNGIILQNTFFATVSDNAVSDSGQYGITIDNNCGRCTVSNNVVSNSGFDNIFCQAPDIAIVGNVCTAANGSGILVSGGTSVSVVSNICMNNDQGTADTVSSGIRLTNATQTRVIGNRCTDNQGTKTQNFGIREDGTSNNNYFAGNDFSGNKTSDRSLVGTTNIWIGHPSSTPVVQTSDGSAAAPGFTFAGNSGSGLYRATNDTAVAANGSVSAVFRSVASAVDYAVLRSSSTGNVDYFAEGGTATINLNFLPKGSGGAVILRDNSNNARVIANGTGLGFFGATAIAQPSGANQAALTNSTGGTRDGTLADVGATYNQATLNNNFTDLHVLVNEIRTALVNLGLMKGSA
jgi:parallel beta-helix repeat protein